MRKLSEDFEVDEGTIRYCKKRKRPKKRNAATFQNTRKNYFRPAILRYPEVDDNVVQLLAACRRMGFTIPPSMVKAKAVQTVSKIGTKEGFPASNG